MRISSDMEAQRKAGETDHELMTRLTSGAPASPGGMTATETARRAAEEDAVVEAMARAMCEAMGHCPDDPTLIYAPGYARGTRTGKMWEDFVLGAKAQLAAHRAMERVLSGKVV